MSHLTHGTSKSAKHKTSLDSKERRRHVQVAAHRLVVDLAPAFSSLLLQSLLSLLTRGTSACSRSSRARYGTGICFRSSRVCLRSSRACSRSASRTGPTASEAATLQLVREVDSTILAMASDNADSTPLLQRVEPPDLPWLRQDAESSTQTIWKTSTSISDHESKKHFQHSSLSPYAPAALHSGANKDNKSGPPHDFGQKRPFLLKGETMQIIRFNHADHTFKPRRS